LSISIRFQRFSKKLSRGNAIANGLLVKEKMNPQRCEPGRFIDTVLEKAQKA
jgi:hypothetical protein